MEGDYRRVQAVGDQNDARRDSKVSSGILLEPIEPFNPLASASGSPPKEIVATGHLSIC